MLYGDRHDTRKVFVDAWQKYKNHMPLTAMEQSIAHLLEHHPEYQPLIEQKEKSLEKEFHPEFGDTNPFLHLSAHLIILEQLQFNNPVGIKELYQQLLLKNPDEHAVQHMIMEVLIEELWQVTRHGGDFDEKRYLNSIQGLGSSIPG